MFDLERVEIPVDCPKCGFTIPATLRQVRLRDVVICRGCKRNVQMEDHLNEVRRGLRDAQRSLDELAEALEELNTEITIEF